MQKAADAFSLKIRRTGSVRILSCFMAAAVMLPPVFMCGCGRKADQRTLVVMPPEAITEDMPWYDGKTVYIGDSFDSDEYDNLSSSLAGVTDEYIIWESSGTRITDTEDYGDDIFVSLLSIFDLSGNKLYEIDAGELTKEYLSDADSFYMNGSYVEDGYIAIEATRIDHGEYTDVKLLYDLSLQEIVSCEEIAERRFHSPSAYTTFVIDGWQLTPSANYIGSYPSGWKIGLRSPQGDSSVIDINEQLPDIQILQLDGFFYLGDSKVILNTTDYGIHQNGNILLDMESGTLYDIEGDRDYAWISELPNAFNYRYYEGVGNIAVDQDGIKIVNMENRTEETYLLFDNCDANRADICAWEMEILSFSEDHIVFGGSLFRIAESDGYVAGGRYVSLMIILDRAENNPHTGDTVLTAAIIGELAYPMAEAIRLFNKEDNGALILPDPRYRYDTVKEEVERTEDMDNDSYRLAVRSALLSKLSIELMAGDAPDLIINSMDYPQLNRPDLLLDLSEDLPDSSAIYNNVIEAAETQGHLYQMPLSFSLDGLLVNSTDVDTSVPGFTYDSYRDYVSGPCNGTDPTLMTRLEFTDACLEQLGNTVYSDGHYDFGSDSFPEMVSFVNSLILPDGNEPDTFPIISPDEEYVEPPSSSYVYIGSPFNLLTTTEGRVEDMILYGFPSPEPSGLVVNIYQSVAVSAATDAPDKCHDFVSSLIGPEYQDLFTSDFGLPVNRDSLSAACVNDCERYNNTIRIYEIQSAVYGWEDPDRSQLPGDPDQLFEIIDGYISSASGIRSADPTVLMIVREEIQAYFAGQKNIDEITGIIQDRVDTLIEERG